MATNHLHTFIQKIAPGIRIDEKLIADGLRMLQVSREEYFDQLVQCRLVPGYAEMLFMQFPLPIQQELIYRFQVQNLLWPVPIELMEDGIPIGRIDGSHIIIRNEQPECNMAVFGSTGSGKTNEASKYAHECSHQGIKVWYFTNKLSDALRLPLKDALLFCISHEENNTLPQCLIHSYSPPPHYSLFVWFDILSQAIGSVNNFMTGGKTRQKIHFYRFLEKQKGGEFTHHDIFEYFQRNAPEPRSGEMDMHYRRLVALEGYSALIGEKAAQSLISGYSIEELSEHHGIVLLPDYPSAAHLFFCALFYIYLIEARDKSPSLTRSPLLFVYEEAHRLLAPQAEYGDHAILSECSRKGRFVEVFLCITSHTTQLDRLFLNNLFYQIFKTFTSPEDYWYAERAGFLTKDQCTEFRTFDYRHGLVKLAGHPAYKCEFDHFPLPEIDKEQVFHDNWERVRSLKQQPVFRDKSVSCSFFVPSFSPEAFNVLCHIGECDKKRSAEGYFELLLESLEYWYEGRPEDLRRIINSLEEDDYVNRQPLRWRPSAGNADKIVHLTLKGVDFLSTNGLEGLRTNRDTLSTVHDACVAAQREYYRRQAWIIVAKEYYLTDKNGRKRFIDLAVRRRANEPITLIETLVTNSHEDVRGLIQCLENVLPDYESLIFVSESKKESDSLKKYLTENLDKQVLEKIQFKPFSEYFTVWSGMCEERRLKQSRKRASAGGNLK